MTAIMPDPEDSNLRDSLALLIVWIIAFFVLLLTQQPTPIRLPGSESVHSDVCVSIGKTCKLVPLK